MREIRFRAWQPKLQRMWHNELLSLPLGDLNRDDLIFMQYTGLKDKNGKEIYEGDILRLDSWTEPQEVTWNECGFCLTYKGLNASIHYIHHAGIKQATIIGNIYENPDLLTSKEIKE